MWKKVIVNIITESCPSLVFDATAKMIKTECNKICKRGLGRFYKRKNIHTFFHSVVKSCMKSLTSAVQDYWQQFRL